MAIAERTLQAVRQGLLSLVSGRAARVSDSFSSRDNSFGLIRLVLASSVIVSHAYPLSGAADREFVVRFSGGQESLGGIAVAGFFVVSGFLVSRSALRSSLPRYAWKRFIRIFPGFWVCLIVTAFVFAPLMWLYERGLAHGFAGQSRGPFGYLHANAFIGIRQYGISGLLMNTPYGRDTGSSVFNGSLWTLVYEVACYVALGLLALAVLRRASRIVGVIVAAILYLGVILVWSRHGGGHHSVALPLVGYMDFYWIAIFGFCFALGMLFELFKSSIPIHNGPGVIAATVLVGSLYFGGYLLIGLVALAYLLIWLAVRLPEGTRRIGRRNDYSYGIYIYAFAVQQMLAEVGFAGAWLPLYCAGAFLLTIPLAMLSWHLVESRAMSLRNISPPRPRITLRKPGRVGARRAPSSG